MEVIRHAEAGSFLDRAHGFLVAREAEHNLILGLSARLKDEPDLYGSAPYLATVEDSGRVVAVAFRTPPHNLVLSEMDERVASEATALLTLDVGAVFESLPGVVGPVEVAEQFARGWKIKTGVTERLFREQRIYRAASVVVPEQVAGRMRPYADPDRDLVVGWLDAFIDEAFGTSDSRPPGGAERILDHRLTEPEGGVVLWEAEESVSLAGFSGPTPNGIRIGPVYTPLPSRRRGYATALVADLTKSLLDGGRRFCFLFTDLANPTSNSIYQRVGYQPVSDVHEWVFES